MQNPLSARPSAPSAPEPAGAPRRRPAQETVLLAVALVAALLSPLGPGAAAAQAQACTFPVTVATAAELNAAIDCFNTQAAGDYEVTLAADIALTAATPAIANGAAHLFVDGAGHSVDGAGSHRPFHVSFSSATFFDVTVTGGFALDGGGIFADRATVTVERSTITGNTATVNGGGIANMFGTVTVNESTITGNLAQGATPQGGGGGGGIYNHFASVLRVSGSTFVGNHTDAEESNFRDAGGGAIYNAASLDELEGGMPRRPGLIVINSTFVANSASSGFSAGGAVLNTDISGVGVAPGVAVIANSTLVGNSVPPGIGGGGIFTFGGRLELFNSIIAASASGGDCVNQGEVVARHNLVTDALNACGMTNGASGNQVGVDPQLDPAGLRDNGGPTDTIALDAASPAINAGDNLTVFANGIVTDQRGGGFIRIADGVTDIGALETQEDPCPGFPVMVATGGELSDAIFCHNLSTDPGEHLVTLTGDAELSVSLPVIDNTTPGVSLHIDGAGHTVDGQGIDEVRPFAIADDTVVAMEHLTITGGDMNDDSVFRDGPCRVRPPMFCLGGGIWNAGTLTITDSTVTANQALVGGGIHNGGLVADVPSEASLTVTRTTISDNLAGGVGGGPSSKPGGGGIFNTDSGSLTVTASAFIGNVSRDGGVAITNHTFSNSSTTMTVSDTVFDSNEQDGLVTNVFGGGAIHHGLFALGTVIGSTFTANRSENNGGAIENGGQLTVVNSTMSGNTATDVGGGISNAGTLQLVNSTLIGNDATTVGGVNNIVSLIAHNTIIAGNAGGDCSGGLSGGHNLIQDDVFACGLVDGVDGNIVGVDPLLEPLADNGGPTLTHALAAGSPAVDAGDDAAAVDADGVPLVFDQRGDGFARISGAAVDMGAFELQQQPDTTPPVIVADVAGDLGNAGWYVSDVTVTWSVTDDESEITETVGCDETTVSEDTVGVSFTCEATSEGGTASESVTVMRDTTAPQVTVTGVEDGAVYTVGAVPEAGCDTTDATSGVAVAASVAVTGGDPDGTGAFTATCSGAVDVAGNAAAAVSVTYTVEAPTFEGLRDLTQELVTRPGLRTALVALVTTAEVLAGLGLDQAANATLDAYIRLVEVSTPRFVPPDAAAQLIALAQTLKT